VSAVIVRHSSPRRPRRRRVGTHETLLIRYKFDPTTGTVEEWHRQVAAFISALEADPELAGRISYRCLKVRDGRDYYHLAEPMDEEAAKLLQQRDWFKRYTRRRSASAAAPSRCCRSR